MYRNHSYNISEISVPIPTTKNSAKTSILSSAVAWVCIAVYLGTMVFAGIRVYTGIKERRTQAEREFSNFVELFSAIGVLGFTGESVRQTITDSISGSKTLQGVIISGPTGEYAFERDRGKTITWIEDVPHFKAQFGLSEEPFSKSLQIKDLRNVIISAVYTSLDYDLMILILKRTLLVVLATLCLALFTLIFQFLLTNPNHNTKGETLLKDKTDHKKKDSPDEIVDESFFTNLNLKKSSHPPQIVPSPPSFSALPKETKGLYAPRSYIGREAYIKDRLSAELSRCVSFGQDMVFMVMELQDTVKLEDARFRLLADEVVKFFLRRDLIFEKGEQGMAIMLPDIDLDQGFAKSEKFLKQILTLYSETFQSAIKLYIGLSSRADRTIDAERFIFEASAALKKAKEDPAAPIVAFRSDPVKYRNFIAAQNKSQPS